MATPSTVIQRAQGNTYIGQTGMLMTVQTGFAVRTGFYMTNSGSTTMNISLYPNVDYDAIDFISGTGYNNPIKVPPGTHRFVPFDFYGLKSTSGNVYVTGPTGASGPAGPNPYEFTIQMSCDSEYNGQRSTQTYPGNGAGLIRMFVTGYVTGYYGQTVEFRPEHPSGFLVQSGLYSGNGAPYNKLKWTNPSKKYFFEKYKLQRSDGDASSWADLKTLSFTKVEFPTSPEAVSIDSFYYGTPTGLVGNNSYSDGSGLAFSSDYYYRLRGEHYDSLQDKLVSWSDWVYGYPVEDLKETINNNEVWTGVIFGSTTAPDTPTIESDLKASTGAKQALKIYLKNNESNIVLKTKFDNELTSRGIDISDFTANFTGVHFILPSYYTVGSIDSSSAGISTGDIIKYDDNVTEVPVLLYLNKGSMVAGHGGAGGNGGYSNVIFNSAEGGGGLAIGTFNATLSLSISESVSSTAGSNGSPAIEISDSSISKFEIWAHQTSRIYGGGGGGGGGDPTFNSALINQILNFLQTNDGRFPFVEISDDTISFGDGGLEQGGFVYKLPETYTYPLNSLGGLSYGGVGGGGQGFGTSFGGLQLGKNIKINSSNGSINGVGFGASLNIKEKISAGGNGGIFGEAGKKAESSELNYVETDDILDAQEGGDAGYAISAASNTNYSSSNFRDKLFFIQRSTAVSDINGFLARWDAGNKSYNTGTTQATNGQTVSHWEATEVKPGLTITNVYLEQTEPTKRPKFYDSNNTFSNQYFNGNEYISFKDTNSFRVVGTIGSNLLENTMDGFELFYNIFPNELNDNWANSQFAQNSLDHVTNRDYMLHTWADDGTSPRQYKSYMYRKTGNATEGFGLKKQQITFSDFTKNERSNTMPSNSFIYNVSAKKLNGANFIYEIRSNGQLVSKSTIRNSDFNFRASLISPVIGSAYQVPVAFGLSDIILFTKKLSEEERLAVTAFLQNKNKNIKTTTTSELTEPKRNILSDQNGFAGFVVLNS